MVEGPIEVASRSSDVAKLHRNKDPSGWLHFRETHAYGAWAKTPRAIGDGG